MTTIYTDAVVRSSFYKYHHPKECLITNGILNRAVKKALGKSFSDENEYGA